MRHTIQNLIENINANTTRISPEDNKGYPRIIPVTYIYIYLFIYEKKMLKNMTKRDFYCRFN